MFVAAENGHQQLCCLLIQKFKVKERRGEKCAELCYSLCIMKVVPDTPVDNGFTALFTAAQFGLRDTVSVLVELGADPDR